MVTRWVERMGSVCVVVVATLALVMALSACSAPANRGAPSALPSGVTSISADSDFGACASPQAVNLVLSAFQLENGPALWAAFPNAGMAPELDEVRQPLNVVVYPDGWPGGTLRQFGHFSESDDGPMPGTVDMCVATADGSDAIAGTSFIVYANVPIQDSVIASLLRK